MRAKRFHGLNRPKLRQSWNKLNLYNIVRQPEPRLGSSEHETFFQQKWRAKRLLRGYHGEQVVERKWERMFSRRLLSVVNMDTKYMAENDGSELAAGRGSGKDKPSTHDVGNVPQRTLTPYMQMTFAPLERRLDTAIFRAMFASSTRQARQFCIHGAVKVNGLVMIYPAYRLNPGDMFQVEPERVLYATGAPKEPTGLKKPKKKSSAGDAEENDAEAQSEEEAEAAAEEASEAEASEAPKQDPDTTDAPEPVQENMKPTRKQIQEIADRAKQILREEETLGVKRKIKLRQLIKDVRPLLSRAGRADASATEITEDVVALFSGLGLTDSAPDAAAAESDEPSDPIADLSKYQLKKLEQRMAEHLREEEENPHDPSKPYETPWRPRNYMSPFAFIPRYLEVNHKVCSAVYLRHPVARVGYAEVPTPFSRQVGQLAFNWYLRRR
ncbi:alpha-L RNA-binding motif-containing protein [Hypoxylon sp. NC1633]|nr:alpha-L RNA-binding motif-containing protein [Hypoxylon sp. NC1633]